MEVPNQANATMKRSRYPHSWPSPFLVAVRMGSTTTHRLHAAVPPSECLLWTNTGHAPTGCPLNRQATLGAAGDEHVGVAVLGEFLAFETAVEGFQFEAGDVE